MSTAVERYQERTGVALPSDHEFHALERHAKVLANSSLLPEHFRKKPEMVMGVALTLHAVGVPVTIPTISMFDDIKGRIQPRVQFQIALAAQRGVEIWFNDDECDATSATVYGRRKGGDTRKLTFTIEQAKRAKLVERSEVWKAYPEVMLRYRAAGWLLRTTFPEVALGLPNGLLEGEAAVEPFDRAALEASAQEVPVADPDTGEILDAEVVEPEFVAQCPHCGRQSKPRATQAEADGALAAHVADCAPANDGDAPPADEEPQYAPGEEPFV